jgi:hypothetical protein
VFAVWLRRYDIGVLTHCGSDVDRLCADAKGKVHGNATVLKCLVENFSQTGVSGSAVHAALQQLALAPGQQQAHTAGTHTQCPVSQCYADRELSHHDVRCSRLQLTCFLFTLVPVVCACS